MIIYIYLIAMSYFPQIFTHFSLLVDALVIETKYVVQTSFSSTAICIITSETSEMSWESISTKELRGHSKSMAQA